MVESEPVSLEDFRKEFDNDTHSKRNDFVTRMDETEESEPRKEPGNKNSAQRMRIKISQNFDKIEDIGGLTGKLSSLLDRIILASSVAEVQKLAVEGARIVSGLQLKEMENARYDYGKDIDALNTFIVNHVVFMHDCYKTGLDTMVSSGKYKQRVAYTSKKSKI